MEREEYLWLLYEGAIKTCCQIHAYVLMTNHVHLLLTPEESTSASHLMKFIGERYVPRFNARHNRTGTLWEGRFKSHLVDSDGYLLTCQRYIEMNPVRAGIVSVPGDYPWSSHQAMAAGVPSLVLTPSIAYAALGATPDARQGSYRGLFASALPDEEVERIRRCINGGFAFGSPDFVKRMEGKLGRRVVEGRPGRPRKAPARESLELGLE
jgi:putative transposase